MRFFLFILFLILFSRSISYAQFPDTNKTEIQGDTIEGETTDSTIVYIIKKAPVTIKERIEIQRSKLKKNIYYVMGISLINYSNNYKSNNGNKEYTNRLNSSTSPKTGISTTIQIYNAPKKNILGFMLEGRRMNEAFRYTPLNGEENVFENSYSYGSFGVMAGKWFFKERNISYQLIAAPCFNYKFGISGYSLNQTSNGVVFIEESISYHKLHMSVYITGKILLKTKASFIEIAPYINVVPFSMTKTTEAFSIRRNIAGMSLILTRRIF